MLSKFPAVCGSDFKIMCDKLCDSHFDKTIMEVVFQLEEISCAKIAGSVSSE